MIIQVQHHQKDRDAGYDGDDVKQAEDSFGTFGDEQDQSLIMGIDFD